VNKAEFCGLHIPAEHEHSFRRNVNTDSGRTCTLIPIQSERRFWLKVNAHSGLTGTFFRKVSRHAGYVHMVNGDGADLYGI
jgi:hypothetical protein